MTDEDDHKILMIRKKSKYTFTNQTVTKKTSETCKFKNLKNVNDKIKKKMEEQTFKLVSPQMQWLSSI